jgi:hypothetical protein
MSNDYTNMPFLRQSQAFAVNFEVLVKLRWFSIRSYNYYVGAADMRDQMNFRRSGTAESKKTLRLQYLTTILSYLVDEYKFARDIHSSGCVYLNILAAGGEIPLAIRVTAKFSFRKGTGPLNATGQSNIRITNLAKDPSMRLPLVVQKANPRQ